MEVHAPWRKLVSLASVVFLNLQKNAKKFQIDGSELLSYSELYRDILEDPDLLEENKDENSFKLLSSYFRLIEIFYLSSPKAHASQLIKEWWSFHCSFTAGPEEEGKKMFRYAIEGKLQKLKGALRASDSHSDCVALENFLNRNPFNSPEDLANCIKYHQPKLTEPAFQELFSLLSGDRKAIYKHSRNRLEAFAATIMYSTQERRIGDLSQHLEKLHFPSHWQKSPIINFIESIIRKELESTEDTGLEPPYNRWFLGHVFDLLSHSNPSVEIANLRRTHLHKFVLFIRKNQNAPHIFTPYLYHVSPESIPSSLIVTNSTEFTEKHLYSILHLTSKYPSSNIIESPEASESSSPSNSSMEDDEVSSGKYPLDIEMKLRMADNLKKRGRFVGAVGWYLRVEDYRSAEEMLFQVLKPIMIPLKEGVVFEERLEAMVRGLESMDTIGEGYVVDSLRGYWQILKAYKEKNYTATLQYILLMFPFLPKDYWRVLFDGVAHILADFAAEAPSETIYNFLSYIEEFESNPPVPNPDEMEVEGTDTKKIRTVLSESLMHSLIHGL
eukprot:TRINITY_DN13653_c0_g1_i1.p1 TRINITY_DN13653_c0_g1~~TRINITY_DN13653_c0_g1_i1.p1  ORF type:complete len:556 (+),score=107.52 TRINITY_DN13653_c0_g1_i1:8-1675(+)